MTNRVHIVMVFSWNSLSPFSKNNITDLLARYDMFDLSRPQIATSVSIPSLVKISVFRPFAREKLRNSTHSLAVKVVIYPILFLSPLPFFCHHHLSSM